MLRVGRRSANMAASASRVRGECCSALLADGSASPPVSSTISRSTSASSASSPARRLQRCSLKLRVCLGGVQCNRLPR